MKSTKFSLPRKYWIYVSLCAILAIALFVNIFVVNSLTGEKEFSEFHRKEWSFFIGFLSIENIIILLASIFAIKAGNLFTAREKQINLYYEQFQYMGIDPDDYEHIWFDFSGIERALVTMRGECYFLRVDVFNRKTEEWSAVNTVSNCDSLADVKKVLFYDFDFFCTENAVFDKHGDEVFRDNP